MGHLARQCSDRTSAVAVADQCASITDGHSTWLQGSAVVRRWEITHRIVVVEGLSVDPLEPRLACGETSVKDSQR